MLAHGLLWFCMVDEDRKYNLELLRGWRRNQLRILQEFALNKTVSQVRLSGVSGVRAGSHALGGKITPLVRANLIRKAGRDGEDNYVWALNEDEVDREDLVTYLDHFDLEEV